MFLGATWLMNISYVPQLPTYVPRFLTDEHGRRCGVIGEEQVHDRHHAHGRWVVKVRSGSQAGSSRKKRLMRKRRACAEEA
jgi:hypothetical protein